MSINQIQLPAVIIQSLYNKSLYDLRTDKPDSAPLPTNQLAFLGSNQKKIAILVKTENAVYLPDEELNFLMGILTACKLSMADIALVNISKNPDLIYTGIAETLKAAKVILFGIDAAAIELPLQFPNYQVQQYNNQVYLSSPALSALIKDKEEKLKLWNCLKNIFSL